MINKRDLVVTSVTVLLMVLSAALAQTAKVRPDVLFIAIDDMNDWTTLFDENNPIKTPNLERLAARARVTIECFLPKGGSWSLPIRAPVYLVIRTIEELPS